MPPMHQLSPTATDPRLILIDNSYTRQPRCTAKICPDCGTIARAYHSSPRWTYYDFSCGAPSYKASRLRSRIEQLRSMPRQTALIGCGRKTRPIPKHRIAPYATPTFSSRRRLRR